MKVPLAEAARVMKGTILGEPPDAPIGTGASIDSRSVVAGDLFFALAGEFLDGHDFVGDALGRGAAAAVVARPVPGPGPQVIVDDPTRALTRLAAWWRDEVDPIVVGITGSTGKTSTKDLLAAVCESHLPTIASEGNLNNDLGLPLTLLRLKRETEVAITEMGACGKGDIRRLCETARPSVGVVTNVGVTHFERFGSQAAIAQAKSELIASLPDGGTAILNADDPEVSAMSRVTDAQVLTFGIEAPAWLTASGIKSDVLGRPSFRMVRGRASVWVELAMSGKHQVSNALAAAAAGLALGISLEGCAAGLRQAEGSAWRMQVEALDGAYLVNDAYNANPTSMASALATCAEMARGGRLIAVLGHMAELGDLANEEHRRLGALAGSLADALIVVGPLASGIADGASAAGMRDVIRVAHASEVVGHLQMVGPGDVVLVKGSRSAGLEGIVEDLKATVSRA